MTTASWSSGNSHTSDAEFRAWGSEFSTKLGDVGLIKTSDTGQINWTTVTRPSSGTDGGYEVWRFNDAMQGTAPIFIKFYFGTGSNAAAPRIRVEVGTGSNGSGTLTGTGSGTIISGNQTPSGSTTGSTTAVPSYMCYADGVFSYLWKAGASNVGLFSLCRTCDADGTPNADGYLVWSYGSVTSGSSGAASNVRMVRFTSPASVVYSITASSTDSGICFSPAYLSNTSLPNGDKQAFIAWGAFPDMRPMFGMCGVLASEFASGTTFTVAMVGSTARTYLSSARSGNGVVVGAPSYGLAFLWE